MVQLNQELLHNLGHSWQGQNMSQNLGMFLLPASSGAQSVWPLVALPTRFRSLRPHWEAPDQAGPTHF
jgi:hypothetical protein